MRVRTFAIPLMGLLALAATRPAQAAPQFFEPYGDIFSAHSYLLSPTEGGPQQQFLFSPVWRTTLTPAPGADVRATFMGAGLAYASVRNPRHPWSFMVSGFNTNVDVKDVLDEDYTGVDFTGRVTFKTPRHARDWEISLIGRHLNIDSLGKRWDGLVAVDKMLDARVGLTANFGYAGGDLLGGDGDFTTGFGAKWVATPRLLLFANYVPENDMELRDRWSISGIYLFDKTHMLRAGGGKDRTFFVNYIVKWDQ